MMILLLKKNEKKPSEVNGDRENRERTPPFDTSDLDSIPAPERDDPPYRDWWVIDVAS